MRKMKKIIDECFFQIRNGANIKQGKVDGGFPITRIETIANDKFNRDRMGYAGITDVSKYQSYVLEDEDLLMSHINSMQYLGRTVLYKKQEGEVIIHGMNLLRLKANKDIIIPGYARYYFYGHTFRSQLKNIIKKSVNQASFAVKDLKKIKIEIPYLEEQQKLVKRLDKIQKIIDIKTKEIAKFDELIQARFVELFGEYYRKHINEKQLDKICDFIDYRGKTPKKSESGIPLITAKNVKNNKFSIEPQEFIPSENYNDVMTRGVPQINDVLFTTEAPLGNVCRIPAVYEKFCVGQRLITMQPHKGIVNSEYLEYALTSAEFQEKVRQKSSGSTVKGIRSKLLILLTIPVPPIELQNRFSDFRKEIDKSKFEVQKSLENTQLLFDSLMQEYFG